MSSMFDSIPYEAPQAPQPEQAPQPQHPSIFHAMDAHAAQQAASFKQMQDAAPTSGLGNAFNAGVSAVAEAPANAALHAVHALGLTSEDEYQREIATHPLPNDPTRISGKVGQGLGGVANAINPVGQITSSIGAGQQAWENADNQQQQFQATNGMYGANPSTAGKAANVLGQAALNYGLMKFSPGGAIGKALLPEAYTAKAVAGNVLAGAGIGGVEQYGVNAASNLMTRGTGVNPNQEATEGGGEAFGQGLIFGGAGQAAHEIGPATNILRQLREKQAVESGQGLAQHIEQNNPEALHVQGVEQRLNDFQPQITEPTTEETQTPHALEQASAAEAQRKSMIDAHEKAAKEAEDTGQPIPPRPMLPENPHVEAAPAEENAEVSSKLAGFTHERRSADNGAPEEGERRFTELLKQANFQTHEEAAPNFFQKKSGENAVAEEYGRAPEESKPGLLQKIAETAKKVGSEEEGGEPLSAAGTAFLKQTVAPAVKKAWDGTKAALTRFDRSENLGFTTSDTAKKEGLSIVKAIADAKIAGKETEAFLAPFLKHVPTFKDNESSALHAADLMEGGNAPSPELQPAVDHLIDLRTQNEAEAKKMGWNWGDPNDPGSGLSRRFTFPDSQGKGSGSVVGSEKFRKRQTYENYSDAYKAVKAQGGGPEYKDPLSDQIAAQYEFQRSLKLRQRLRASEDEGNVAWSPAKEKLPEGHKVIDDKVGRETRTAAYPEGMVGRYASMDPFEGNKFLKENADKAVYVRPGEDAPAGFSKTDHQVDGNYHAAEDVAGMWNNAAHVGEGDPLVKLPETIARGLTNFIWDYSPAHAITGVMQHLGKSLYDGIASVAGFNENSVRDIASDLNLYGPQTNRILKEIKSPGSDPDPKVQEIAKRMQQGGAGIKTKSVLDKSHWEGIVDKAKSGNWQGAGWDVLRGISKEIKAGTYDSVLNRIAAINAKREVVNQMGKGIGAEAGQASVFKAAEAVNRGLGRHTDIPDFKDSVIARVGKLIMPAFKFRSGLVRNLVETTRGNPHAAAMVIGNLMAGAITGTAISRMAGGRWPSSLQDIYNPPDGRKNDAGHEERISMGIWSFVPRLLGADGWSGVKAEMKGMTSPLITSSAEVANNKDFSGNQIRPEGGSTVGNAARGVGHVAQSMLPLAAKSQMQANPEAQPLTAGERALHFAGWNAGHPITSPAEKEAYSMLESRGETGGRTPEKAEQHANQTKWTREIQQGQGDQARQEMAADPTMTQERRKTVFERATTKNNLTRLVERSSFGPQDLLHLWQKGDEEDRGNMKEAMRKRAAGAQPKSPAERDAWIALRKEVMP